MTPRPSDGDREALEVKLRTRLDRLPRERRTLVRALAVISPDNDLQALVDAFNSVDEDMINRVRASNATSRSSTTSSSRSFA